VIVAVVGKGEPCPEPICAAAETLGAELAVAGLVVLTGGRGGVGAFAQNGASQEDGLTVALTPLAEPAVAPASVVLRTGLTPQLRNVVMGSACDAMVALPGRHGTQQEVVFAVEREVPVLLLDTPELAEVMDHAGLWLPEVPGTVLVTTVEAVLEALGC
jgi:uncharacterized protein (TIGR00725 family)